MKVFLFFPPVGNLCQPYLSTPALTAYLKQNGVRDVSQYDLNVETLDELLSSDRLRRAYRWCYHHLTQPNGHELTDVEVMKLQMAQAAVAVGPRAVARIGRAKEVFRSRQFYRPERYQEALDTLRVGYHLLSSRYFPTVINNQSFTMRYRLDNSDDILAAVGDQRENCFLDILSPKVADLFEADGIPDVAGVSIGCFEQLIPGLTLAGLI